MSTSLSNTPAYVKEPLLNQQVVGIAAIGSAGYLGARLFSLCHSAAGAIFASVWFITSRILDSLFNQSQQESSNQMMSLLNISVSFIVASVVTTFMGYHLELSTALLLSGVTLVILFVEMVVVRIAHGFFISK